MKIRVIEYYIVIYPSQKKTSSIILPGVVMLIRSGFVSDNLLASVGVSVASIVSVVATTTCVANNSIISGVVSTISMCGMLSSLVSNDVSFISVVGSTAVVG